MNKKYLLIIIAILLFIILLIGAGYLIHKNNNNNLNTLDKIEDNTTQENSQNSTTQQDENKTEDKEIVKIYPERYFVYDANYSYNFQNTMVNSEIEENNLTIDNFENPLTFATKESTGNIAAVKVPFINIKNDSIEKINEDIQNLYIENAKKIDEARICNEELCPYINLTYKVIEDKNTNTLTILILNYEGETSVPIKKIYGYVIDLATAKLLNLDDIAKKGNINTNVLKEKTINKLNYYLDNYNKDNIYDREKTIQYYNNNLSLLNNYCTEDGLQSGLIYYIDENGIINVITNLVYSNAEFISGMFTYKLDN